MGGSKKQNLHLRERKRFPFFISEQDRSLASAQAHAEAQVLDNDGATDVEAAVGTKVATISNWGAQGRHMQNIERDCFVWMRKQDALMC